MVSQVALQKIDCSEQLDPARKNDPHIGVLAAFPGPGWDKLGGKNSFDLKTIGGLLTWCNSAVFLQSERFNAPVSTRTETDCFTGFPGSDRTIRKRIGACIGLIFATLTKTPIQGRFPVSCPACFSQTLLRYWLFLSIVGFQWHQLINNPVFLIGHNNINNKPVCPRGTIQDNL